MMNQIAEVIAIDGETVIVRSQIKSSCSACQQQSSCGSGQVAKAFPLKQLETRVDCQVPVKLGDMVELELPQAPLLASAWQVYGLPLIGLLLGAGIGQWLLIQQIINIEIIALILASACGFAGFKLASWLQHRSEIQRALCPKVVKILPQTIPVTEIHGD